MLLNFKNDPGEIDGGYFYYCYESNTPSDRLVPEDIAVTLLINSQVNRVTFKSIAKNSSSIDLTSLPNKSLEQTSSVERDKVASLIAEMSKLPNIKASVSTKILHKKRPKLIPILDNQAIFGAYFNSSWPKEPFKSDSIGEIKKIREVLEWIHHDLTRNENIEVWQKLENIITDKSRIELFDMIWWSYFKEVKNKK